MLRILFASIAIAVVCNNVALAQPAPTKNAYAEHQIACKLYDDAVMERAQNYGCNST